MTLIKVLTIAGLLIVVYQDIKYRAINIILFPILFVLLIFYNLKEVSPLMLLQNSLINLLFITLEFSFIIIFLLVKLRKTVNPLNGYIGVGDVLFWMLLCLSFSPLNFVFFFISSLIFSLVLHLSLKYFYSTRMERTTIPLAGYQAMVFALLVSMDQTLSWGSFHSDSQLLHYLI